MRNPAFCRRSEFVVCTLALGSLFLLTPAALFAGQGGCPATTPDILGPYYRPDAPIRDVIGQGTMRVSGSVTSTDCTPIAGAQIEIWQANPSGEYDFYGEDYNYYARIFSGENGSYQFFTDLPGLYPARPVRHIHYRVTAEGFGELITQQYFRDVDPADPPAEVALDFSLIANP